MKITIHDVYQWEKIRQDSERKTGVSREKEGGFSEDPLIHLFGEMSKNTLIEQHLVFKIGEEHLYERGSPQSIYTFQLK
ncbi:hypothetical protein CD798_06975 [Bacillaceae bacterium SAOS 7]|nr:hypothetical protein CD798_06975 [Bacillaceae bacterium SAOS 7]